MKDSEYLSIPHEHEYDLIDLNGVNTPIDKPLSKLITELNKVGLYTHACCQGGSPQKEEYQDDPAYISIPLTDSISIDITPNHEGKQMLIIQWKKDEHVASNQLAWLKKTKRLI